MDNLRQQPSLQFGRPIEPYSSIREATTKTLYTCAHKSQSLALFETWCRFEALHYYELGCLCDTNYGAHFPSDVACLQIYCVTIPYFKKRPGSKPQPL